MLRRGYFFFLIKNVSKIISQKFPKYSNSYLVEDDIY